MRSRGKLILAVLAAALLMGLSVGSASAGKLSVTNRSFRATWEALRAGTEGADVNPGGECPVTLEGTFHSMTIRKVARALIGHITRAQLNISPSACTGGSATLLQETLPWHVTYESFSGALPNIETVTIGVRGVALRLKLALFACLYRDEGGVNEALKLDIEREAGGGLTTITPDSNIRINRFTGPLCPPKLGFSREGEFMLLGRSTLISIRLI